MKNKLFKIALCLFLFSALLITSSYAAEIKENVTDYTADVFIMGSTRFDGNQVITAEIAAMAGINEAQLNLYIYNNPDFSKIKMTTYYYNSLFDEWHEIKKDGTTRQLAESEIKELDKKLNIFFENNKQKKHEYPYTGTVDAGSIWSPEFNAEKVEYKNNKFYVPALTLWFTFTSNGLEYSVDTEIDEEGNFLCGEFFVNPVHFHGTMSYLGGASTQPEEYHGENGYTIGVNNGYILWSEANPSTGRNEAGNIISYRITAPAEYNSSLYANAKIVKTMYYSDKANEVITTKWSDETDKDTYIETWEEITETLQKVEIEVEWIEGNIQIFTILISPNVELAVPQYKGSISYLGGISQEPIVTGNEVMVEEGIVNWYPADANVGRYADGNRFGFKITAPTEYENEEYANANVIRTMYYSNKDCEVFNMIWKDIEDGEAYYEVWPVVTENLIRVEITIEWTPGNTQTFIIHVGPNIELAASQYKGSISYLGGISVAPTVNGDEATVETGIVNWYPVDENVGRYEAGNRFGFKITAPAEYESYLYDTAEITRTMYYSDRENDVLNVIWQDVEDEDTYVGIWPKVTETLEKVEITIKWMEGNTQTFTINVGEDVELAPSQYKGTISYLGGVSVEPNIYEDEATVYSGIVSWYPANTSVGRNAAGNRIGFKITAPAEYLNDEYANANITRTMYYSDKENEAFNMTWSEVKDGDTYYETWPVVTETLEKVEIAIEWIEGNTQTFTINVSPDIVLEPSQYKGTISYLGGMSVAPTVNGDEVTVEEGIVSWYPVDENVGRYEEGNRFGFKITAPAEYVNDEYAYARITRTMCYENKKDVYNDLIWSDVKDGDTYVGIWPLVTEDLKSVEIKIEWIDGNIQTFTINVGAVELQTPGVQVGDKQYADLESAILDSSESEPAELTKSVELTEDLTIKSGNALVIPEGIDLTTKPGTNVVIEGGAQLLIEGTYNLYDGSTIDGNIKLQGGKLLTDKYNMAGPQGSGCIYITDNAVLEMSPNGDLVIVEGDLSLGTSHRTLPGQKLTLKAGATFTVPEGINFDIYSNVIIEEGATVTVNGTLTQQEGSTIDGNVTMNGGTIVSGGVNIVGKENAGYLTENAVFYLEADGDITVVSGDMELGMSFNTMAGQNLILKSGSTFTIPTGKTLNVYSNVVVEVGATLTVNGTLKFHPGAAFTGNYTIGTGTVEGLENLN